MDANKNGSAQVNQDDHLGYNVYAQTLWSRIQTALNRDLKRPDKTLGDDPLVVGIFGEWGSGKSFLLKQVLEKAQAEADARIKAHQEQDTEPLTVPVFFQPWKYEHEEHLLVPLLLHIQSDLQSALQRAMPDYSRNLQWLEEKGDALAKHMGQLVDVFGLLMDASLKAFQIAQPQAALLMPVAKTLASWLPWNKGKTAPPTMAQFRFDNTGGRSYYEMHAILKAITRPNSGSVEKYLPQTRVDGSFSINFVIFIDDLDRCLPEKSVAVLELIKTVFNLESFAFVLALDDEVVERGIGHRYRDYTLVNKKTEMPITGFEYLEKIVHLPLRLPPLTTAQATDFLPRYEARVLSDRALRLPEAQRIGWVAQRTWFAPRTVVAEGGTNSGSRQVFHLAQLVVASFDTCAPRKLVRVVELWHQVLDVLEERALTGLVADVRVGGAIDPRLLMTMVLLQLFQPELFRSLRRSRVGLNVLLDGFKTSPEQTSPLSAAMSDLDLLHWAVYRSGEKPPVDWRAALECLPGLDPGQRGAAQRQRLPLVERLLEHRSVQRNSFDPLKLLAAVHRSGVPTGGVALPADCFPYFSVMGAVRVMAVTENGDGPPLITMEALPAPTSVADAGGTASETSSGRESPESVPAPPLDAGSRPPLPTVQSYRLLADPVAVFQALISPEDAEQRHVAEVAGLGPDAPLLHPESSRVLRGMVEREFLSVRIKGDDEAFTAERRSRVLRGLSYLAPHIPPEERAAWWALVEDAPHQPAPFESLEQLHTHAHWMNLRSALREDERFDPDFFFLPKNPHFPDKGREPLPGFVRVLEQWAPFRYEEEDLVRLPPFCIARFLTTVDQFGAFIDAGGYTKEVFWDSQGWAWVTGEWDNQPNNSEWLRERLLMRPVELRKQPFNWEKQRPWGSRPVFGLNWFEARAYACWLDSNLAFREKLSAVGLSQARVALPIEAEWVRAVHTEYFFGEPVQREYAWGNDPSQVELKANVSQSGFGEVSPVGLFFGSPLGICDLNGNLWEWQDSVYRDSGIYRLGQRIPPPLPFRSANSTEEQASWLAMESIQDSARLAVRGGAWSTSAEASRASSRFAFPPDEWEHDVGFRLVLYLS